MKNLQNLMMIVCMATFLFSCEKEEFTMDEPFVTNEIENNQRERNYGLEFTDSLEYSHFEEANLESSASLIPEMNTESRASVFRLNAPPIGNQGGEGSCTAFAAGYCVSSYYIAAFWKKPYTQSQAMRSPEYIYNSTKAAGSCSEAGAYLGTVLNFIRDKGVSSWTQMPYSDQNGCSLKPNSTQISQGKIAKIKSWGTVAKNVNAIKEWLKKGYPVIMAFDANSNFENQTFKAPFIYKSFKAESGKFGHAVAIIGYDDSKQLFIIQNSWGTNYHDKGIFYVTYGLFPSIARELYVMVPVFPSNIQVRHASKVNEITIKVNDVDYKLKKGQTISIPANFTNNATFVWECIINGSTQNCKWDGDYKLLEGQKYKIIDKSTNYDLQIIKE